MNTTEPCGVIYRKQVPPCQREKGHAGGHNGFSDRPPLADVVKTPLTKKLDPNQGALWGGPDPEEKK